MSEAPSLQGEVSAEAVVASVQVDRVVQFASSPMQLLDQPPYRRLEDAPNQIASVIRGETVMYG